MGIEKINSEKINSEKINSEKINSEKNIIKTIKDAKSNILYEQYANGNVYEYETDNDGIDSNIVSTRKNGKIVAN